jgi:hypothetical protein
MGAYDVALERFKAAFLELPDPAFLFNIAQCQRQLKQYDAAERSYRSYLREASPISDEMRRQVERLIDDVVVARAEPPPTPPPPSPTPPAAAESVVPPVALAASPEALPPARPRRRTILWATLGGVGAAVAVVAIVLGVTLGGHVVAPTPSLGVARGN